MDRLRTKVKDLVGHTRALKQVRLKEIAKASYLKYLFKKILGNVSKQIRKEINKKKKQTGERVFVGMEDLCIKKRKNDLNYHPKVFKMALVKKGLEYIILSVRR